mgnify:CR=1 FL=1
MGLSDKNAEVIGEITFKGRNMQNFEGSKIGLKFVEMILLMIFSGSYDQP